MIALDSISVHRALILLIASGVLTVAACEIDRTPMPRSRKMHSAHVSAPDDRYMNFRTWPNLLAGVILFSLSLFTSRPVTSGLIASNLVLLIIFSGCVIMSCFAMNASNSAAAVRLAKTSIAFRPIAIVCCVADVALSQPIASLMFTASVFVAWICISLVYDLGTIKFWRDSQSWWQRLIYLTKLRLDQIKAR